MRFFKIDWDRPVEEMTPGHAVCLFATGLLAAAILCSWVMS